MVLDQPWEQDLVRNYAVAAYVMSNNPFPPQTERAADALVAGSLVPLLTGTLVVQYRVADPRLWSAYWEFSGVNGGATWHAVLVDDLGIDQIRPGKALKPERAEGAMGFAVWLKKAKPHDVSLLDFGQAMQNTQEQPVDFSVGSSQAGRIPAIIRELAHQLGVLPDNRSFSFRQVMRLVLQRGIVLTDNRRLPLQRRFPLSQLSGPVDLRDGAAVGGEIFRLKNGDSSEKERFQQIQATFKNLTGRKLDVRARPASDGEPALIIEPTIAGQHGERLVELSGAGMQEAIVLQRLKGRGLSSGWTSRRACVNGAVSGAMPVS